MFTIGAQEHDVGHRSLDMYVYTYTPKQRRAVTPHRDTRFIHMGFRQMKNIYCCSAFEGETYHYLCPMQADVAYGRVISVSAGPPKQRLQGCPHYTVYIVCTV